MLWVGRAGTGLRLSVLSREWQEFQYEAGGRSSTKRMRTTALDRGIPFYPDEQEDWQRNELSIGAVPVGTYLFPTFEGKVEGLCFFYHRQLS